MHSELAVEIMSRYFPDLNREEFLEYLEMSTIPDNTRYIVFPDYRLCTYKEEALNGDEEFVIGSYSEDDSLMKIWHSYGVNQLLIYEKLEKYYLDYNITKATTESELLSIIEKLSDVDQTLEDELYEADLDLFYLTEEYPTEAKQGFIAAIDLIDKKYYRFNGLGEKIEYGLLEELNLDWRAWFNW